MKKIFIPTIGCKTVFIVFLLLLMSLRPAAQTITNYSFAASSETFTALSGATSPFLSAGTVDDGYVNGLPMGFDFWYMGVLYNSVSVSTNGWFTLGSNISNSTLVNSLTNASTPRPVIAPLWDDLDIQASGNLSYQTSGSAGSRVFTLQYLNVQWQYDATGNTISFQARLYEGSGKIEFIYRPESGSVSTPSASIGITATGSGSYLSLNGAGTSPTVSSTTETATINAKPALGQKYSFTPPVAAAPTNLTFSNVTATSTTLNWTDNATNEVGYVIYRSTDGINYSFVTQTAAGVTLYAQTGLTPGTTYYTQVYAVSEGALSTALSGSQATPNNKTFTGTGNFSTAARWSGGTLPIAGDNLIIDGTCTIDNNTGTDNVAYGTLTIGTSTGRTLNWITSGTNHLNVSNVSAGSASSTLSMTNGGSLIIRGTWTSTNLTFTRGTGTVEIQSILTLPAAYTTYNHLIINGTGATVKLGVATTVAGNLTITAGTLNANNLNMTVGGNWTNNASATAFTAGTATVTFNGSGTGSIGGAFATTFKGFTMNRANGVTLGAAITVGGVLGFTTGKITTGSNTLYLNSTGTISRTSGHVIGNFKKFIATGATSKTFEMGDAVNYTPVTLAFASVTTAGDLMVTIVSAEHLFIGGSGIRNDRSVNKYWTLTNSGILFTTASLTMNWAAADVDAGATTANFKVGNYNNPVWLLPTVASPLATSIQTTGLTAFGDFIVGELCGLSAAFSYSGSPYCSTSATATPVISGTAGAFTAVPALSINAATGVVNPSASGAGTYTVTNTVTSAGGCSSVSTANITITAMPSATLSYAASPYAVNGGMASITFSGTTGGTYTSTAGLSINASTGAVTLGTSTPGTYTVTYTVAAAGGCAVYTATASITIVAAIKVFTGTGNFSDASKWTGGTLPAVGENLVIDGACTIDNIITTDNVAYGTLTIGSATGRTLAWASGGTNRLNVLDVSAGAASSSLNMTNGGTLIVRGTWVSPNLNFIPGTGTIEVQSALTLPTAYTTYNNITVNALGLTTQLGTATTVTGNVLLSAGTLSANNINLSIAGNWTNNSATTAFTAGSATITFGGTSGQAIGGTYTTSFNNLTIANTGSTVTLMANTSISGNLLVSVGIFDLASFTANRVSAGGTLMVANNATLKIGGTNTYPLNYTTNTLVVAGTVAYSGTNQTIANQQYGNLVLSSTSGTAVKTLPATPLIVTGNLSSLLGTGVSLSFNAASAITVSGNISIGAATIFNAGSYAHTISGNWVNNGVFNGATGTITFAGTGTIVSGTGSQLFNNLTVAAPLISFLGDSLTVMGNLATTGSGSCSQLSSATLVMTGSGSTINGSGISLNNLTINGTISTSSFLNITGNLSVNGTLNASSGNITMSGTLKTITGTGIKNFGALSIAGTVTAVADFSISSALTVNGSLSASAGTATFTGTSVLSGTANLFNTVINGTSLQLLSHSTLGVAGVLAITAGALDIITSTPNTVNFNSTGAQTINNLTFDNLILSNGNSKTATGGLIINNSITIASGTTFIAGAFTHTVYKDWNNNGSFMAGTSTVQFLGPSTSNINGATDFNVLTVNAAAATVETILHSDVSAAIVNMTNGIISTGSNMLTITNTRTGNGKILGHIQRSHSFTTGVAYAFESPDNIITFSSVLGVTSITIFITENPVANFPFGGAINKEYSIAVPTGVYNAALRFDYEDDERNGNDESTMTLWNYNGASWTNMGKSANSTTDNYVEQNGLTSLTNRWTLSAASNVVRWNGSVSADWHTAANWTVMQGAPATPPSIADIAELGTASFAYEPSITSSEAVNRIYFGSVQPVTLTLASGGSLTVSGNVDGVWQTGATHTIDVNNQTLTVQGDMLLSDGINGQTISVNIASGTMTVLGSLAQTADAHISFSSAGTLNVYGNFNYSSGIFSAGSGTVVFNGNENQAVANLTYHNLTIEKTAGLATINDTVNILGHLSILSGQLNNASHTTIVGDVSIASGAILQNNDILKIGGNWVNSGNFIGTGVNVIFNGSGTQNIAATTFNNFTIDKPVGSSAILTGNIYLNGNLTVTSGTLNIQSFICDRSMPGGKLTLADSATYIIGGNNAPALFSDAYLAPTSTVIADGTGAQAIFNGIPFGNLVLRNAGAKILVSPITVDGNLTIENGSNFDAGANTITLNGNWINNGTFNPSASTLVWSGIAKTISGATTFNQVLVTGSYSVLNNIAFNGLLNITHTGSLNAGPTVNATLNGDLINSGSLYTLGTTTYSGNVLQTLRLIDAVTTVALRVNFNGSVSPVLHSTSAPQFGYLTINNTAGVNPSVDWTILYAFTVNSGASFNGGASTHKLLGAVTNNGTITSNGGLNFIPSAAVGINLGTDFSSTGTVNFGGTGAIGLSGTPVSFSNLIISNSNPVGITPSSDWSVTKNFEVKSGTILNAGNHAYFVGGNLYDSGTVNTGTSTFVFNGVQHQTISNMDFYNLESRNDSGIVTLLDARVNNDLTITKGTTSIGDNTTARAITVDGNIIVDSAAVLTVEDASDAVHQLTVGGNIINNGILNLQPDANSLCNTRFNKNGIQTISGVGITTHFNRIIIDQGLVDSNYLDITAASFTAPNGFLTLQNGSLKLNSTGVSIMPFTQDIATGNFLIPATAGLWVHAGTVNAADMNWTVAGLVKATGGVLNMGSVAGNTVIPTPTARFVFTGGNTYLSSRISNPGATWSFNMQGGTLTVNTLGTTAAGVAPFNMDAPGCGFSMLGGTLVIQNAGGAEGENLGYNNLSTTGTGFTGGVLQTGNALTTTSAKMGIISTRPVYNLTVNSAYVTTLLSSAYLQVTNDVMVTAGTLNIANKVLKVGGAIGSSGNFIADSGTVVMNGSAAQTIAASTFAGNTIKHLTIDNNAGVTLGGALQLTGALLAAHGAFNAAGYLTLMSTATQTALIDGSGTGSVLGNVTMQRYLASGFGYKYVSSPFEAATVNEFADDLDLNAAFPSFYKHDENLLSAGWVNYTNTTGILVPGLGYAANFGAMAAAKTVAATGVVNNNTIATPTLYNHNRLFTKGFNLVGNPYPSPIDWDAATGWSRPNIDDAVYYFNASTSDLYGGTYSSYINGVSSDGVAGNIIPAMQGFFVHVTDGSFPVSAQLTMSNSARTNTVSPVFHSFAGQLLRMSAGFSDSARASDATVLYFDAGAGKTFDKRYDALKLMNANPDVPNLYAIAGDADKVAIRAMAYPSDSVTVQPLGLEIEKEGWVSFKATAIQHISPSLHIYLLDAKTNTYTDLRQQPVYRLFLAAGDYQKRFSIVFSLKEQTTANTTSDDTFTAYSTGGQLFVNCAIPSGEKRSMTVFNMAGQLIYKQELTGSGNHAINQHFTNGIYVVSLAIGNKLFSKKVSIIK